MGHSMCGCVISIESAWVISMGGLLGELVSLVLKHACKDQWVTGGTISATVQLLVPLGPEVS
jgi:hypothetical protein